MDSLTRLHLLKLFKKYDYLTTELRLKSEISNISHSNFISNINKIIAKSEKLRETYTEQIAIENKNIDSKVDGENRQDYDSDYKEDDDLKRLYKKIVKLTHPDVVKNDYLNTLYIEATDALKSNDSMVIYKICVILDLEFSPPADIVDSIDKELVQIQKKINFIESSYHMRWHNSEKEKKIEIVYDYLSKQLKLSEV